MNLTSHWPKILKYPYLSNIQHCPSMYKSSTSTEQYVQCTSSTMNDKKIDLANQRIGEVLTIPYEVTASDFWREMWQSVFYQQDRIHTSLQYVNEIKGDSFHSRPNTGIPIPFSQMLFVATSMSHVDDTRNVLDLAFRNCIYEKTVFPGDTLKRNFQIQNMRESSNGENILVDFMCKMYNQFEELVFRVEKTMYFEKTSQLSLLESGRRGQTPQIDHRRQSSTFKKFIQNRQSVLPRSLSVQRFEPGQLVLHTMQRPMGIETSMNLSMLHRMTHPLLYNTYRFSRNDESGLVVGGVPMIAMAHSFASKELHEVLYEELLDSHLINTCMPEECMGAFTYIMNVDDAYLELEEIECITVGVKEIDVVHDLDGVKMPLSLFEPGLFPRDVEDVCARLCPILEGKIVVHSYRKLLRHKPKSHMQMPLL